MRRRIALTVLTGLVLQIFAGVGIVVAQPAQAVEAEVEAASSAVDSRPCHEVVAVSPATSGDEPGRVAGNCLDCCLLGSCCAALTPPLAKEARVRSLVRRELVTPQPAVAHALPRFRPPILTRL